MNGKNEVSTQRHALDTFLVKDIFYTVQGEGPYAGSPAVFIRLGGCNLRCTFCDTDFSSDLEETTAEEITRRILRKSNTCPLVVITGGEPMLQNLPLLISQISKDLSHIKIVQIETAGTVWPTELEEEIRWGAPKVDLVVSPKTPKVHEHIVNYAEHWKYIVTAMNCSLEDGLPNLVQQGGVVAVAKVARPPKGCTVYVQPMDEYDFTLNKANAKAAAKIAMEFGYRVSLQLHKILDLP